jgi:hypothetical protein
MSLPGSSDRHLVDGAETGSAMHEYAHGVMDRVLTAGRPAFEDGAS